MIKKYKILFNENFRKNLKKLAKKHRSIDNDMLALIIELEKGNFAKAIKLKDRQNIYKTRVRSSNNNKGKSGGFRIVFEKKDKELVVLFIDVFVKSKRVI